jgi:hypothetical protein
MPSASSRSSPEQAEEKQDPGRDQHRSDRHLAPLGGGAPWVRLAKIGAQPGRIDDHEQRWQRR